MRVYFHFSVAGFSNSYVIATENGGDVLIVDPGVMDVPLLNLIENNGYYVRAVLITHSHESHIQGLRTLLKIYNAEVFAAVRSLFGRPCREVHAGEPFSVAGLEIDPLSFQGHSNDSVVYRVDRMLFTGDVLGAGHVGTTPNRFAHELLVDAIKEQLLSLEEDLVIFPGHGAPSTLTVEKRTNPAFQD